MIQKVYRGHAVRKIIEKKIKDEVRLLVAETVKNCGDLDELVNMGLGDYIDEYFQIEAQKPEF